MKVFKHYCDFWGDWVKASEAFQAVSTERTRADRAEARVKELEARIAEQEKPKTCEGCERQLLEPHMEPCLNCNWPTRHGNYYTPRLEGDK